MNYSSTEYTVPDLSTSTLHLLPWLQYSFMTIFLTCYCQILSDSILFRRLSTHICCWVPVPAPWCSQLLINIYCRRRHSAANPPAADAVNQWNRQTDTQPLYRPYSAYYVGSVNNWCNCLVGCSSMARNFITGDNPFSLSIALNIFTMLLH